MQHTGYHGRIADQVVVSYAINLNSSIAKIYPYHFAWGMGEMIDAKKITC